MFREVRRKEINVTYMCMLLESNLEGSGRCNSSVYLTYSMQVLFI